MAKPFKASDEPGLLRAPTRRKGFPFSEKGMTLVISDDDADPSHFRLSPKSSRFAKNSWKMSGRVKLTCLQLLMVAFATLITMSSAGLQYGFYNSSCPNAEQTVTNVVNGLIDANPAVAPALIRLIFHDCFVAGCDASILLDPRSANSSPEKTSIPLAVAGYNAVDQIKTAVEAACPGTVSCADIVAFAARDSVAKAAGYYYSVDSGRRDGSVSTAFSILTNMPSPLFNRSDLVARFIQKKLTVVDLVALSGAHSIGVAHCSAFTKRLYPTMDPTLDATFAADLKKRCPAPARGVPDNLVNNSVVTPAILGNQFYGNAMGKKVLFNSDATLLTGSDTATLVSQMAADPAKWIAQFAVSMVNMGRIGVLTGTQGQVRKNCRVVNS
ncbi:peroxidase 2-like [Lolium rigidum]|uniref:peroxidase 2-like n=1 Tax=Lolium rigidum TaxID=89674 RepID=UPI001F5CDCB3|nr:peroxidase 2-like [Lolium rigidum]